MSWLREFLKSSYTRLLEQQCAELKEECARDRQEMARLRQENRGLVNSLLGTAGFPPLSEEQKESLVPTVRRGSWHQIQARTERESVQRMRERASKMAKEEDGSREPPPAG